MGPLALITGLMAAALDGGSSLKPQELGTFTLAATGDIMMHDAVKLAATTDGGFRPLFAQPAITLSTVDLGFGNLETPVAPKAGRGTKPFVFNAPLVLLPALKEAGFGLVLAANNHAYDFAP